MATERQIVANRRNAKRSSGPITSAGRGQSRLNALKHGLNAKLIVIVGEDPAEFDSLRAELGNDLAPVGVIEEQLVDQLCSVLWRLRRIVRFEAVAVNSAHQHFTNLADDLAENEAFIAFIAPMKSNVSEIDVLTRDMAQTLKYLAANGDITRQTEPFRGAAYETIPPNLSGPRMVKATAPLARSSMPKLKPRRQSSAYADSFDAAHERPLVPSSRARSVCQRAPLPGSQCSQ